MLSISDHWEWKVEIVRLFKYIRVKWSDKLLARNLQQSIYITRYTLLVFINFAIYLKK